MSLVAFIAGHRTSHHVPHAVVACRALTVSESWFCKWYSRHPHHEATPTEQRRVEIDAVVAEAFATAHGLHGLPRIHAGLRVAGWVVSEETVAKSMSRQGLAARDEKAAQEPNSAG